ncbi:MAG: ATP-binding protein [Acidimicrobiia bacterium]|nr:ATP-binding protein [Acidimicrobiia bacterium]
MSLRLRVALGVALIVAVTIAGAGFAAQLSVENELDDEVDDFLEQRVDLIEGLSSQPTGRFRGPDPNFSPLQVRGVFADFDSITQLLGPDGQIIVFEGNVQLPVGAADLDIAREGVGRLLRDVDVDDETYRMITAGQRGGGALQIARDLSENDSVLAGVRSRLVWAGLIGTIAAAVIGWLFARRAIRPVERVTAATEEVARTQDLMTPLPVEGTDEIARLSASFNTMIEALATSREQQRRLVMDASHELRTPLATLRTSIEVLERGDEITPELRERLMTNASAELVELSLLVGELVELATDTSTGDVVRTEVALGQVVGDAVERGRQRHHRIIELEQRGEDSTIAAVPLIERAVNNLIDNAAKFSPAGEPIEVVVDATTVTVRDHGPGIDDDDLGLVFDRFYRATTARTMTGSGLGLSIVEQIVADHDGFVFARNAPGGGAEVGFTLPPSD